MTTNTSTPQRFYRPELDVLRFIAFLLVFLRHAPPLPGAIGAAISAAGQSGVCLFFLLSAYLITELLEREATTTNRINLRLFYIRRILRIWPLYFFALALARLIDIHPPHLQMSNGRLLASLLLAGNWYTYAYGLPASFALVLWSVAVEEQFYILWPGIRRVLGRRALLITGLLTLPISYAAILWLCHRQRQDIQLWVNTFVQLQFFGIGGLLALLLQDRAPALSNATRIALATAGLLAFAASELLFHGPTLTPTAANAVREYATMMAGTLMLFFAILGAEPLRKARPLIYLGKISYGLYVFHILGNRLATRPTEWLQHHANLAPALLQTLSISLSLALTTAIAALSYRYLEAPFLRLKDRFAIVRSRSV